MKNFFTIFSLPESFDIDLSSLEKTYLNFQNQFHPDKNSKHNHLQEDLSIYNEAYKVLNDDFLRLCHLLSLKGIDIQNDEKSVKIDISILEMAFETQEKITKINNQQEIINLKKSIETQIKSNIFESSNLFKNFEFEKSAQKLLLAKYLKNALQNLKEKKRNI